MFSNTCWIRLCVWVCAKKITFVTYLSGLSVKNLVQDSFPFSVCLCVCVCVCVCARAREGASAREDAVLCPHSPLFYAKLFCYEISILHFLFIILMCALSHLVAQRVCLILFLVSIYSFDEATVGIPYRNHAVGQNCQRSIERK
jgi:hypothetical protein